MTEEKAYKDYFNPREQSAIVLRVPDSGEPWLDDMIRRSRRMDAVQAAMAGLLAGRNPDGEELSLEGLARCAAWNADAVIAREAETWWKA